MNSRTVTLPKITNKIAAKDSSAVAYLYSDAIGRPCMACFSGKRNKPDSRYRYADDARRMAALKSHFENVADREARKIARRAEQRAEAQNHSLKVGDVLSASWGYDQTNVDFYQVTKLVGKTMVEIREISAQSQETGHMSGECVPSPNSFKGEPMRKKAQGDGVRIASYAFATRVEVLAETNGVKVFRASRWSSYA